MIHQNIGTHPPPCQSAPCTNLWDCVEASTQAIQVFRLNNIEQFPLMSSHHKQYKVGKTIITSPFGNGVYTIHLWCFGDGL